MRVTMGGCSVFVGLLAMFVRCGRVLLRFFMLTKRMVMMGLMVVMRRSMVMSGR
jgi:hypothetical protein